MRIRYPDYENSILSLSASVLRHYGVPAAHKTLPEADALLAAGPRNVILILCDGMGSSILDRHLMPSSFLRRQKCRDISSVFPSTTVAATTSVLSGLSPAEHAWLGWDLYFEELSANVTVFTGNLQYTDRPAAAYDPAKRYLPYTALPAQIRSASPDIEPHLLSRFEDERLSTFRACLDRALSIAAQPGRHFLYVYTPEPDTTMHHLGTASPAAGDQIHMADRLIARFCAQVPDAAVFITADHGQLDSEWIWLAEYPDIADLLVRPPSIESRAASLFVRPGYEQHFRKAFTERFGRDFLLLSHDEVLASGLFGPGTPSPRTAGFLGSFLAVSTGAISLGWQRSAHPKVGMHAGLTEAEMLVPLITFTTQA